MAHKVRGVQRCCGSRSTRSPRSSIRCATQPDEKTTRSPGSRQSGPTTSCGRKRVAFGEPPCHRLNITFFILTITHCQHTGLAQQPDPLQIFYVLNNNTPYLPNPLPTRSMDNPARARQRGVRNARQAPAAAHRNDRPRPRPHAQRDNHGARHPPENLDHVGDHHGVLFAADICEAVLIARDMVSLVLATVFELLAKILLGCECSLIRPLCNSTNLSPGSLREPDLHSGPWMGQLCSSRFDLHHLSVRQHRSSAKHERLSLVDHARHSSTLCPASLHCIRYSHPQRP